ncbi:MAG: pseudaminic acid biosynthesis-associated methylase [Dissulfuribacterales bacterium]
MPFKTEQESFWHGEFGTEYIDRNKSQFIIASNLNFFSKILASTRNVSSIVEFGCNVGLNLIAFRQLKPDINLCGVEINPHAVSELKKWGGCQVIEDSILEMEISGKWDLSFTKGVLIHINPEYLSVVYKKLYDASRKYILVAEYYNPTPVAVKYRGHDDRLFKRDFAGEIMDQYLDLELVEYGFVYRNDPNFPQDDLTWFLLKKK